MKHKKYYILYISVVILLLLVPFAGMAFQPGGAEIAEKQELKPWPELHQQDGKLNLYLLSDMGDYFQHHFAFRPQIVYADSLLKRHVVKSGAGDQVIIGRDGWLFFKGATNDYLGRELMSPRELYSAVHNLSLIQQYAQENGSSFLLTVAPNKNSLYGKYMPYNYLSGTGSNISALRPMLERAGINYADLFELFEGKEELYFRSDSHWNNKGAALVYGRIMDALGKEHEDFSWETRDDHTGDLEEMLYLLPHTMETQYYPVQKPRFSYVNEVTDNMDAWIETVSEEKTGSLYMYRDSFGESLLPFFAGAFGEAYFSRLVPYDFGEIEAYQPDNVVLEIVERSLIDFVARAPILPGRVTDNMDAVDMETASTIETETDGSYLVVKGKVDSKFIKDESDIYISIYSEQTGQTETYKTIYLSNEQREGNRYCLHLEQELLPPGQLEIKLILSDGTGNSYAVQAHNMNYERTEDYE